jgi:hypothetical protein
MKPLRIKTKLIIPKLKNPSEKLTALIGRKKRNSAYKKLMMQI